MIYLKTKSYSIVVNDPSNGQRIIRTKADANPNSIPGVDYPIFQRNYIGKVVYVIPQLGAVLGAGNNSTNSGGNTAQSTGWYNNPGTNIGNSMVPTTTNSTVGSSSNGPTTNSAAPSGWQTFSRLDYNLQHPSDWTVKPGISGEGIMLEPNNGSVRLEFGINDISVPFYKELAAEKAGLKLTEFDNTTFISGHPAAKAIGIETGGELQGDEVIRLLSQFGGKSYNIDYYGSPQAYYTYLPTAQQIIDSFNVTSPG
jgi:hypothetical protein